MQMIVLVSCPTCFKKDEGSSNYSLFHCLVNGCSQALNQGCLLWCDNFVLICLKFFMSKQVSTTTTIFADLSGHRAVSENSQATIPVDLSVSTAQPDKVLIEGKTLRSLELTVYTMWI